MSWLSTKWDELTGKNQKVGLGTIDAEYNKAFGTGREQLGFEGEGLGAVGREMMDPNSARNQAAKARMESSGADAAAESSRLAGRNAAMAGGAPAAALAAQTAQGANKAQAGSMDAFNQYLGGQFSSGVGMVSGAANNMTQMNQTQMNARSNQRQANAQIDSQATGFGANLLGKGLGAMFNPMSAVPIPGVGGQRGGYLGYQDGDYVDQVGSYNRFALESDAEAMDNQDIMRYRAMSSPEGSSPEMWDSMGERGQGYMRDAMLTKALGQEDLSPEDRFKLVQKMSTAGRKLHYSQQEGMQRGGNVTPNTGGMLSQIMGPDGIPIHIRTRIGGQTIGQ